MKYIGKIAICLAAGVVLNAGAGQLVSRGNPYESVVARNIFGLNPPTPPVDPSLNTDPPPKITPNGIMSIFGHLQVLFKVAIPAKPGKPSKDDDYILSEGQMQDDIEVTHIDEKAGMVTFNNHGQVQELPLVAATANTSSSPVPAPRFSPSFPPPRGHFPGGNNSFGNRFNHSFSGGSRGMNPNNNLNNGSNMSGAPSYGGYSSQPTQSQQPQLTPAAQAAAILLQTEAYKEANNPAYRIMPPVPGASPPTPGASSPVGPPMP